MCHLRKRHVITELWFLGCGSHQDRGALSGTLRAKCSPWFHLRHQEGFIFLSFATRESGRLAHVVLGENNRAPTIK